MRWESRSRCRTVAVVSSGTFWLSVPRSGLASTATTRSPRREANVEPSVTVAVVLPTPALQAQHGDLVAAGQRLVDPGDQLPAPDVGRALARVDRVRGDGVDEPTPSAARDGPTGAHEQPGRAQVGRGALLIGHHRLPRGRPRVTGRRVGDGLPQRRGTRPRGVIRTRQGRRWGRGPPVGVARAVAAAVAFVGVAIRHCGTPIVRRPARRRWTRRRADASSPRADAAGHARQLSPA